MRRFQVFVGFVTWGLPGLLVVALLAGGCARASRNSAPMQAAMEGLPPPQNASPGHASPEPAALKAGAPASPGRSLIVTLDLMVTVADVDGAATRLRERTLAAGGYVADSSTGGTDGDHGAHLELRVPGGEVEGIRTLLASLGKITTDKENSQDVTEARADLAARLTNARVEERRLLDVMQQRTGTIGDLLMVEKEVARVREDIERLEAQQRAMDIRIDLATVRVTLSPPPAVAAAQPEPWRVPRRSIAEAWHSGVDAAQAIAVYSAMMGATLAPSVAPPLMLAGMVLLFVRARRRATKRLLSKAGDPG